MKISPKLLTPVLCLCFLAASDAFPACPGEKNFNRASVIRLESAPIQARYFRNLSTAQIEAMRHHDAAKTGMHNPGITVAEHELKTDCQVAGIQRNGRGAICVWAETVNVTFDYRQMDVYISNQYAEGTCPYRAILAHENQHVAINLRVLKKYKILMERALKMDRTIPTKGNPLSVRSVEDGKKIISQRIERIVNPLYARFKREITLENGKIDTMASYRRVNAKCKDW
jgi:hypothetical protein